MTAPHRPGTGDRPIPATGAGRSTPRRPGTGSEAHPDAYSPGVPGSQVAVRILGATAVVLAVALGGAPPELLLLVFGAAIFAAIRPEPAGAALSLVAVILACLGAGPETGSWAALAPALGLLVEHTCLVVVAGAPPRARLPARMLVRAGLRALAVGAVTTAVWAVVGLAPHGIRTPPLVVAAALGLLFVADGGDEARVVLLAVDDQDLLALLAGLAQRPPRRQRGAGADRRQVDDPRVGGLGLRGILVDDALPDSVAPALRGVVVGGGPFVLRRAPLLGLLLRLAGVVPFGRIVVAGVRVGVEDASGLLR